MSTASVLIAADPTPPTAGTPRYTLLLSTDQSLIEAAQCLRHDVLTSEPGFALAGATDGRDADRFDEHCDHLLVRGHLRRIGRLLSDAAATGGCRGRRSLHRNRIRRRRARPAAFRPAMFQAAIDAGRPVQPLQLTYHHRDGSPSTVAAFIGDDTLFASICRLLTARRTIVHVPVESLQLPGDDRRDLAARCEKAVRGDTSRRAHGHALVA